MRLKPFLGLGAAHVVVAVVEPLCTLRKSRCGSVAKNDGGRVGVMAARLSLLLQQTNGYQPRARRKEIQKGRVAERARARQPIYSRRAQRAEHNARFMCHVFLCFHVHCAFVLYRAVFKHFVAFEKRRRNVRGRGMEGWRWREGIDYRDRSEILEIDAKSIFQSLDERNYWYYRYVWV